MKRLLQFSRYFAIVAVISCLVASLIAFFAGAYKTGSILVAIRAGERSGLLVDVVKVMDTFLVASALLIFTLGLYEIFIAPLGLPERLTVNTIEALKSRLASVIVLVLAITALERLEESKAPITALEALYVAAGVTLVGGMLIYFSRAHVEAGH
jgi:uncharacterized membrane protein YqhA